MPAYLETPVSTAGYDDPCISQNVGAPLPAAEPCGTALDGRGSALTADTAAAAAEFVVNAVPAADLDSVTIADGLTAAAAAAIAFAVLVLARLL